MAAGRSSLMAGLKNGRPGGKAGQTGRERLTLSILRPLSVKGLSVLAKGVQKVARQRRRRCLTMPAILVFALGRHFRLVRCSGDGLAGYTTRHYWAGSSTDTPSL
jgi:hypothetical protein